jgi:8-hydroxy-5-deazaflavin:NADPH oxidoreductase
VRIGIVGSGNIGGTLAALLSRAGHGVTLSNRRGPASLADQVAALGPAARAGTIDEAAVEGELVVVAIPLAAYRELPADALAGRVVVDAMNYYPGRDGPIDRLEGEGAIGSSELVAEQLADSLVVKAFNTIHYARLRDEGRPAGEPGRLAIPVAGDDAGAKEIVGGLISEIGFDPVDAGTLADGRRQQPGTPVYNQPFTADEARAALAS